MMNFDTSAAVGHEEIPPKDGGGGLGEKYKHEAAEMLPRPGSFEKPIPSQELRCDSVCYVPLKFYQ